MSKNKKELFLGAATAIITPFYNGQIDYKALGGLIDFQLDGGIETIVVAGTTGEAPALTYAELEEIFAFSLSRAKGKAKIIAGCGCNNTERAVDIGRSAKEIGCDGLLAVAPYYNRPTPRGLVSPYLEIADKVELPLILYNVPSRTGVNIGLDVLKTLAVHPRIVGLKEASGNISFVAEVLAELGDELDIYSGNDDMIVPVMALGGKGCISVASNILPFEVKSLCQSCLDGCFDVARELQLGLMPLVRALFAESNPIPVKYALSHLGFCAEEYRLPMCPPSEATKRLVEGIVETM